MRRRIAYFLGGFLGLLLLAGGLSPGPQHALVPRAHDLTKIAPHVWTDAPKDADTLRATLSRAQDRIAAFHGDTMPRRMILCSTQACAARFGLGTGPVALAYGARLVIVAPDGLTPATIGHELSHVALHRDLGVTGMLLGRIPTWANEGVAVWLSPDPRYHRPDSADAAAWITRLDTARDWRRAVTADTWRDTYGAAGRMVESIAQEIGTKGLRRLIDAAIAGQDFDTTLAHLRSNT